MIKDKVTSVQISVLLFSSIVGVGILALPNAITSEADVNGWISIAIGGSLVLLFSYLMVTIGLKYQAQSILDYASSLVGKFLSKVIAILFLLYFLFFISMVLRISADVTKLFLLDRTIVEIIMFSMLLMSTYLVVHGINAIARFNEFIQPTILFLLLLVLTFTIKDTDFGRLLPVMGDGVKPLLQSLPTTFFSFLGFEVIMFLLPFMQKPEQVKKATFIPIVIITLLYMLVTVLSVAVLGAEEVKYLYFPSINIIKNIEVPGAFIERMESVMMLVWIPFSITTMVIFHYITSLITTKLVKVEEHRVISLLLLPIIFLVAILPGNILIVADWSKKMSYVGMFLSISVPTLFWGMHLWKTRRRAK